VAPAADGRIWYTAQRQGALGRLDPQSGATEQVPLGPGSAPHGVIVDGQGAAWVTDSGLNAIVRVDGANLALEVFPLPASAARANLNTAVFDPQGRLWFTGQNGFYGRLDPATRQIEVWPAPLGRGPYASGVATVIQPPTERQGARRIWSDSHGRLWISEWNSGQVSRYDPDQRSWRSWPLPGDNPRTYSVYVDERDQVWLTDFAANAIVHFDPVRERFQSFPSDRAGANVRQMLGRPGEAWGAESGTDRLVVVRY
jgi:virginiamycin B lyase